jgi:hypothetical protein
MSECISLTFENNDIFIGHIVDDQFEGLGIYHTRRNSTFIGIMSQKSVLIE